MPISETAWSVLEHAYGSAEDLPTLLARLYDGAEADRLAAVEELGAAVVHQGDTCQAAAFVVPALFTAAAAQPYPKVVAELLWRLAGIGNGVGFSYLGLETKRRQNRYRKQLREAQAADPFDVSAMDPEAVAAYDRTLEGNLAILVWTSRSRAALQSNVAALLGFLVADSPVVREAAAAALAAADVCDAGTVAALQAQLAAETDDAAWSEMVCALIELGHPPPVDLDPPPARRIASLLAQLFAAGTHASEEIVHGLVRRSEHDWPDSQHSCFGRADGRMGYGALLNVVGPRRLKKHLRAFRKRGDPDVDWSGDVLDTILDALGEL